MCYTKMDDQNLWQDLPCNKSKLVVIQDIN